MKLTKLGHSCVRIEEGDRVLVIDPGVFSDARAAVRDADAVLITHEHPDHVDVDALRELAQRNPELPIWAPASVAGLLDGVPVTVVEAGATIDAAGFAIETFGGQHALIHPTVPVVANVGYLVEGLVYHPGDCLVVPPREVQTLLVPIHAPWSKTAEVVDFVVSVRAPQVFQIHDALLTDAGLSVTEAHVARIGGWHGAQYRHLAAGESVTL